MATAQRIPHPVPSTDKSEKVGSSNHVQNESALKPKRSLKAMTLAYLLSLYTVVTALVLPGWSFVGGETKVKIFYLCTLSVPIFLLVLSTTAHMGDAIIIVRDAEGKPERLSLGHEGGLIRSMTKSTVFSILVIVSALWFKHPMLDFAVYSAVMLNLTQSKEERKLKPLFYFALLMGALKVFLVGMAFVIVRQGQKNGITLDEGALYALAPRAESSVDWNATLICGSGAIMQYYIFAMAYRFDYTNSLASDYQPLVSNAFPGPYFGSAIFSVILAYAGAAALYVRGFDNVTYESLVVVATYFIPVVMVSSMVMLAATKGQLEKFQRYEEDWLATPSPNEPEASETDGSEQKDERKD